MFLPKFSINITIDHYQGHTHLFKTNKNVDINKNLKQHFLCSNLHERFGIERRTKFQIFFDIYFSSYGHFCIQNMIHFRNKCTITWEKKSEIFRSSFVSERFSTIWTKKSKRLFLRGRGGVSISLIRRSPNWQYWNKRCAMCWNVWKNNLMIFVIFSFGDMVDFLLVFLKMDQNVSINDQIIDFGVFQKKMRFKRL